METVPTTPPAEPPKEKTTGQLLLKDLMGFIVVIMCFVIVIILIAIANCSSAGDSNERLLSIILPLVATWMGTVLAFYFSKENFTEANLRVKELMKQAGTTEEKLKGLVVNDVMNKTEYMGLLKVDDMNHLRKHKVQDVLKHMKDLQSERMPVLQNVTLFFVFLIYRTTIERFFLDYEAGEVNLATPETDPAAEPAAEPATAPLKRPAADLTMGDMFDSDFKLIKDVLAMSTANFFLPAEANLEQVKQLMNDNSLCQDVFITKTGKRDEAVMGWVTNNDVVEKADLFKRAGARI